MWIHNTSQMKERRKELRKSLTFPERILWNHLKNSQLGCKFRRKHSFGGYVLDFYCSEKHLAIELDGGYHDEDFQKEYDYERDNYLQSSGIILMHFQNEEVTKNPEHVIMRIREKLQSVDIHYHQNRPL